MSPVKISQSALVVSVCASLSDESLSPSSGYMLLLKEQQQFAEWSRHMCSGWFCRQVMNSFTSLPSKQI